MSEARSNARVFPVLAVLAFIAGVVFPAVNQAGTSAGMFACSAVMFATSWFFSWKEKG